MSGASLSGHSRDWKAEAATWREAAIYYLAPKQYLPAAALACEIAARACEERARHESGEVTDECDGAICTALDRILGVSAPPAERPNDSTALPVTERGNGHSVTVVLDTVTLMWRASCTCGWLAEYQFEPNNTVGCTRMERAASEHLQSAAPLVGEAPAPDEEIERLALWLEELATVCDEEGERDYIKAAALLRSRRSPSRPPTALPEDVIAKVAAWLGYRVEMGESIISSAHRGYRETNAAIEALFANAETVLTLLSGNAVAGASRSLPSALRERIRGRVKEWQHMADTPADKRAEVAKQYIADVSALLSLLDTPQ